MEMITSKDLEELIGTEDGLCVSLYMPTHPIGGEARQDPLRLRNMLRQAADRLAVEGMRPDEAEQILGPARELVENPLYWGKPGSGLALFVSRRAFRAFRLPVSFKELTVIGPKYHVTPVLPLLDKDDRFFVIVLNQKNIRLFRGTHFGMDEIEMKNVPRNLDNTLQLDLAGKRRQYRVETGAGAAQRPGSLHGQGVGTDATEHKKDILRFFQAVDRGLAETILARETAPLVLAGAEYLLPIFREASSYKNVLPGGVPIHVDGLDNRELHRKVLDFMGPSFERRKSTAVERFRQLQGTGKASDKLEEVVAAAFGGRVLHLLVSEGSQRWGVFDPQRAEMAVHSRPQKGDLDLLDYAAVQTVLHDGFVFAVPHEQMPEGREIAAVFRY